MITWGVVPRLTYRAYLEPSPLTVVGPSATLCHLRSETSASVLTRPGGRKWTAYR